MSSRNLDGRLSTCHCTILRVRSSVDCSREEKLVIKGGIQGRWCMHVEDRILVVEKVRTTKNNKIHGFKTQDPRHKTRVSLNMYLTSLSHLASMGDCVRILGGGCHFLGGGIDFRMIPRCGGGVVADERDHVHQVFSWGLGYSCWAGWVSSLLGEPRVW